jgi:hypothetical protein
MKWPAPKNGWVRWFAWYPVTVNTGERVWWESVERRRFESAWVTYYLYRLPEPVEIRPR